MIKVKHVFDAVESADGRRIWVEPIGLTRDVCEWQSVSHLLTHLAPPPSICEWFENHSEDYEGFRFRYFDWLSAGPHLPALHDLAKAAQRENVTLLHHGDEPDRNSATALYEFLCGIEASIARRD